MPRKAFNSKKERYPDYQKQIIETFVNSVYLYEDHLILNYNYKNGTETFSLDEVNEAFGSDLKNFAPPISDVRLIESYVAYFFLLEYQWLPGFFILKRRT